MLPVALNALAWVNLAAEHRRSNPETEQMPGIRTCEGAA
jgi:hypothetical protein